MTIHSKDDILQVRSFGVCFYVLRDSSSLYLIDGGFIGGVSSLRRALKLAGWESYPIKGIILTHGHLDHILNVSNLVEATGAWVAAPTLDQGHYEGLPTYKGLSKLVGVMEKLGRLLFGFRAFQVDRYLNDGDLINISGGLRVVHLPGHTEGHCGLYSESRKLLFAGDLFASLGRFSHLPPRIFNRDEKALRVSVGKALDLDLTRVLPNHCDQSTGEEHLKRLRSIACRL